MKLEEKISEQFPDIECDFLENSFILYRNNYINQDDITFSHYLEEGKMLKNFLIDNNLANENNYKTFFSLQKRNWMIISEMNHDKKKKYYYHQNWMPWLRQ